MKTLLALPMAMLLLSPMIGVAADVDYQHPNLTIVAKDEPLDSVLKSVGKEMQIFVTTPTGLNPVINCDIQGLPIKQAFKRLLGDMSYSLEWKDDGELLAGLTILAGSDETFSDTASGGNTSVVTAPQVLPSAPVTTPDNSYGEPSSDNAPVPIDDAARIAEREADEVSRNEERQQHEAEMELLRQEESIAHEARMVEAQRRSEAGMSEYLNSQGLDR